MDHETLKERTILQQEERKKAYQVIVQDNEVEIDKLTLILVENFKSAFDADKLAIRYTPLLAQYDFLVGDISAGQLRLKGFYNNSKTNVKQDQIDALQDYLYEYVNFGAPYFVLENINPRKVEKEKPSRNKRRSRDKNRRDTANHHPKPKATRKTVVSNKKQPAKRVFTIKQK
ncbi:MULTISPECIES: YutD family protein [Leuconostoc]|uniref:YutD family protein n=1 Tax=Leuconostoc TaxID=1243 RepID=UPI000D5230A2|nr:MULTISPECIES: YutD family protein [Leuconostoc]KAA8325212.1 DUF1027 domain-containing protein [Leuconostoc carnosum]KAA8367284.1 DUF1027 domain-containing protein [Leuconostoc carnosum]KAA8372457.1 DUF1027 domain-containing protein [Leuconostoc carnosum]KAA8376008.1 DUF1027 domain-containing protein [Leuconostoc carnosum]KAA8377770.1 DUF1027 domain-containing protein [Leuconostoc carnosum]